jgi:peptide/nickel transport system permease protein
MGTSLSYLAERSVIFVATVVISVTAIFFVPHILPGNPLGAISVQLNRMGGGGNNQVILDAYRHRFGLDKSLSTQYVAYLRQLLHGDLGYSISSFPTRVSTKLWSALPWTLGLVGVTTLISWLLGSLLGAIVGWSGGRSRILQGLVPLSLLLYTTPYFILAIVLSYLFAFRWPIFPLAGAYSVGRTPEYSLSFAWDVVNHGMLPALSIILVSLGWWFLSMRSLIIAEKGQDYILWAESKGLQRGKIFWGYALRNALLPQATGLALSLGSIVSGALITEVIYGYPGLGYLVYTSITSVDYPVIQGAVLLIILSVALANFAIDMLYPFIDPRIRAGGGGH